MIAVDTNILLYAHRRESEFHARAIQLFRRLANDGDRWLVPLHCLVEFYGVATHRRIYSPPSTPADAIQFVNDLLAMPGFVLASDTDRTWLTLVNLLVAGNINGPHVHDARIAAVCIDYGVSELWSVDRGFSRFPQIKVVNPLVKP